MALIFKFKKNKTKINFPQTLGGKSPSERKYQEHLERYGDINDQGSETAINRYGIKMFQDGVGFVIDAKTGRVIERTREVRYLGYSDNGEHYYVHQDNENSLSRIEVPYASFPEKT